MASRRPRSSGAPDDALEQIKRLAVIAVFSDDELLERLVLKGGNALNLAYQVTTRASIDLDFSMEQSFAPEELEDIRQRIDYRFQQHFSPAGYTVFDVELFDRLKNVTPDLADFWGGYGLHFKLIDTDRFRALGGNIEEARRRAHAIGPRHRTRFEIDISKFEYCGSKQAVEFDGYTVYVYTPETVVCEKLRAICQQMPEYVQRVKSRPTPRARDFIDIHDTIARFGFDLHTDANKALLGKVFAAKRVELALLGRIALYREFHRQDWPAVEDAIRPGVSIKPFDFYFDFVLSLVGGLT